MPEPSRLSRNRKQPRRALTYDNDNELSNPTVHAVNNHQQPQSNPEPEVIASTSVNPPEVPRQSQSDIHANPTEIAREGPMNLADIIRQCEIDIESDSTETANPNPNQGQDFVQENGSNADSYEVTDNNPPEVNQRVPVKPEVQNDQAKDMAPWNRYVKSIHENDALPFKPIGLPEQPGSESVYCELCLYR